MQAICHSNYSRKYMLTCYYSEVEHLRGFLAFKVENRSFFPIKKELALVNILTLILFEEKLHSQPYGTTEVYLQPLIHEHHQGAGRDSLQQ